MKIYGSIEDALYDESSVITVSTAYVPVSGTALYEGWWEMVLFNVRESEDSGMNLYARFCVYVEREDHANA